jgi:NADPH:quinone reductase-like Zn-dependent oxidoreductase
MYTVIGLGGVGCRVAKCFQQYSQYNVICIDDEPMEWKDKIVVKKQQTPEEYEEKFRTIPKRIKDKIKENIVLILSGSSMVSSIALKFLYQIRDKNITILYVRPEFDLLDETETLQDKTVFSVMQEYARSGLFKNIYLTNNSDIDVLIENASIKEYYPAMNNLIASIFHMLMVFDHQDPVVSNFSIIGEARRVCTLGVLDMKSGSESLLFPMTDAMDIRLYYGISKESLAEDKNLQRNIIKLIKEKNQELCKYSYGVYETQYESNFCYMKIYSSKVQEF